MWCFSSISSHSFRISHQQVFHLYDAAMGRGGGKRIQLDKTSPDRQLARAVCSHPKSSPSSYVNCSPHVSRTLRIPMVPKSRTDLLSFVVKYVSHKLSTRNLAGHGTFLKGSAVIILPHLFTPVNCTKCTRSCKKEKWWLIRKTFS